MYSLLYADDTLRLSETEEDMQRALDATLKYCIQNKMTINVSKTKYMICSRGKIRKQSTLYINRTAIERFDTFCYLGVVLKYNNTFQAALKNNVDKAKKALFKLDVLMSKIDLEIVTKLHLFDVMIKPILLYGCEVWGHEDIEQIEVFHRNFLRRLLRIRKSAPKAMTYGELGQQELKFTIWQRMASFWKKLSSDKKSFADSMFWLINSNQYENKWILSMKNIMVKCGIPMVDTYVNYIRDAELKKYIKQQCEDLAIQSWHTMLHSTSLCDCYRGFKHQLLLEPYLQKMKGKQRVQLSQFRCAPYTSPGVTERITDNYNQNCPFCCKQCKADEYHMIMVCEYFTDSSVELLPDFYYLYPNMVKFDQLMNTVNFDLLKKLSSLCGIICNAYTSSTS